MTFGSCITMFSCVINGQTAVFFVWEHKSLMLFDKESHVYGIWL